MSNWLYRATALNAATLSALFVSLFVNWETIHGHVYDIDGTAKPQFVGTYGLGVFEECDWATWTESEILCNTCQLWMANSYPNPDGVADTFLAKNAAVVAFIVLSILVNLIGTWSGIETILSGRKGALSVVPSAVFSFGTAVWTTIASFMFTLIAWGIFASVVTDDRMYYVTLGYTGGIEVMYGPGFALAVLGWILSILTYASYSIASKESVAPKGARAESI